MLTIVLNGIERRLAASTSVAQLLAADGFGQRVAVEINREIVPKANYDATIVRAGDHVEIINFVGGG